MMSGFAFLLGLVLLTMAEQTASHLSSGGPNIADVNILLPPKMTYPVEYRLQGSDGCFKWFFVGYGLELSRLVPLIIFHVKRKYICKTEGELKAAWQPSDLGYGTRVPGDMLIITVVLYHSVIAPLILPFGVLYFGIGWLVLRNQALKVYCPAYESNGKFWPHMQIQILAAQILYQVTMVGFLPMKKFFYAPILIPLPIISVLFGYICSKKFYRFFQDPALEVAAHELKDIPNMEQIYKAYLPQSLSSEKVLLDDDQFEDAKSNVSRTHHLADVYTLCSLAVPQDLIC